MSADHRSAIETLVLAQGQNGLGMRTIAEAIGTSMGIARGAVEALLDDGRVGVIGIGSASMYVPPNHPNKRNVSTASLVGLEVGRLVVTEKAPAGPTGRQWAARCACGTPRVVVAERQLRYRATESCGCLHSEAAVNNGRTALGGTPESFWERVDKSGTCWLWTGGRNRRGYGKATWYRKTLPAHRLAWILANGEIQNGLLVCHKCDNPPCCNPDHLFLGTPKDNMQDMVAKGRNPDRRGELHPTSKLKESDVLGALRAHTEGKSCASIARNLNVSSTTIEDIVNGRRWTHVERASQ